MVSRIVTPLRKRLLSLISLPITSHESYKIAKSISLPHIHPSTLYLHNKGGHEASQSQASQARLDKASRIASRGGRGGGGPGVGVRRSGRRARDGAAGRAGGGRAIGDSGSSGGRPAGGRVGGGGDGEAGRRATGSGRDLVIVLDVDETAAVDAGVQAHAVLRGLLGRAVARLAVALAGGDGVDAVLGGVVHLLKR